MHGGTGLQCTAEAGDASCGYIHEEENGMKKKLLAMLLGMAVYTVPDTVPDCLRFIL